jgi:hypothetical protein
VDKHRRENSVERPSIDYVHEPSHVETAELRSCPMSKTNVMRREVCSGIARSGCRRGRPSSEHVDSDGSAPIFPSYSHVVTSHISHLKHSTARCRSAVAKQFSTAICDEGLGYSRDVSQPEILGPGFREPSGRYRVTSPLLDQYGGYISSWLMLARNFHH